MENRERLEQKLKNAGSLDEVVKACAEEGITVTKEQLEASLSSDPEGELSAEALDNVSGGGILDWIRRFIRYSRASNYSGGNGSFGDGGGRIGGR